MLNLLHFLHHERAQGMVEYALIIVLVAIVLIIIVALVGSQLSTMFSQVISAINYNG